MDSSQGREVRIQQNTSKSKQVILVTLSNLEQFIIYFITEIQDASFPQTNLDWC